MKKKGKFRYFWGNGQEVSSGLPWEFQKGRGIQSDWQRSLAITKWQTWGLGNLQTGIHDSLGDPKNGGPQDF